MKKFLICLLVVAIALLGFTGCPSPASDDGGDSGPTNSVDGSIPELAELREITSMTVDYGKNLTPANVAMIVNIVNEIEVGEYGEPSNYSTSKGYPAGRAAEDYSYEDNESYAYGYVRKAVNYPVFYASYGERYPRWTRALPDGWLAPGDVYEVTSQSHSSVEYSDITVKQGDKKTISSGGTGLGVGLTTYLDASASDYNNNDIHIDGKVVRLFDQDYSNEYTKVSDDHEDYYYTRNGTNSKTVKRAYAVDIEKNLTKILTGGFKISYTYTEENSFDDLKLKYIGSATNPSEEEVAPYFEPKLTDPLGFSIDLKIYGKKNTNSATTNRPIVLSEEMELLSILIPEGSTWDTLVKTTWEGRFARVNGGKFDVSGGSMTNPSNVNLTVLNWILADSPYEKFVNLPANIKEAILAEHAVVNP